MSTTSPCIRHRPTEPKPCRLAAYPLSWSHGLVWSRYLAGYYKVVAKLLFLLSLVLAFAVVTTATLGDKPGLLVVPAAQQAVQEAVFILSVCVGFLTSLDAFINANAKWRQLRTFAGMLASIAWQYRTRVAPFDPDPANPESTRPEKQLRDALVAWRKELAAGADLNRSVLRKRYPAHVYKHQQREGGVRRKGDADGDDHFSPVQATEYINMRLRPSVTWYQRRIPVRSRQRTLLKLALLLCAAASAVLARFSLSYIVTIVTAFASLVTAWIEFSDHGAKIERYSRAAAGVENLLTWWSSISPVERAATTSVSRLVLTGEAILSQERLAWMSTASKDAEHDDDDEEDGADGGGGIGGASRRERARNRSGRRRR